jgi:hypothetical protein
MGAAGAVVVVVVVVVLVTAVAIVALRSRRGLHMELHMERLAGWLATAACIVVFVV